MSAAAPQRGNSETWPEGPYFEDFSVGQRLTARLCRPSGREQHADHGMVAPPLVPAAAFLGLVSDSGVLPGSKLRVLATQWRDVSGDVGAAVEATFTVTRCRRVPDEGAGSVQWHAQAHGEQGRVVHEGTVTVLLPARSGSDGSADPVGLAFCTPSWGEALARRLADDRAFSGSTATWDGSIGLRSGGDQIQLRVYRGRVLEVAARTPQGATFTLEAPDDVWTGLVTGPSNDFFRRAMSGDSFTVTGNAYEYLRMSKALVALIDAARDLATETPR